MGGRDCTIAVRATSAIRSSPDKNCAFLAAIGFVRLVHFSFSRTLLSRKNFGLWATVRKSASSEDAAVQWTKVEMLMSFAKSGLHFPSAKLSFKATDFKFFN